MERFAALFESLDTTTSTAEKIAAMAQYFREVPADDGAWAVFVLMGRRLKRILSQTWLRSWLTQEAALPEWLVDETYASVGDLAETIALLTAPEIEHATAEHAGRSLASWFTDELLPLRALAEPDARARVVGWWRNLPYRESFLVNKLLTGSLRVGVSRGLVTRALAESLQRPRVEIERALMGEWSPEAAFWESLRSGQSTHDGSQPYPFYLASPLEQPAESLGERREWLAEWKWDGIRGQLIRRAGAVHLWSRGEDLITERFPEIVEAGRNLPEGTVLDGEVLIWRDGRVRAFAELQRRIGRKSLSAKLLAELPARFLAYDLLELDGEDLRARPLQERRERLEAMLGTLSLAALGLSTPLAAQSWDELARERERAREFGVEGLMLKARASAYGVGRQRGAWWKWKIDPYSFDAVLTYAQAGHGRRSNLYTDYTFSVWDGPALVTVAKAYSGLDDAEIRELDRWIRTHTLEKFGPVRRVEPVHVFELAFENIAASSRHRSGVALRFPRIKRWRTDKPASEADSIESLRDLLAAVEQQRA